MENGLKINKAFLGQKSALKLQLNKENEAYIHVGKKNQDDKWEWQRAKFEESELGSILQLLTGKSEKFTTVHEFEGEKKSIAFNMVKDKNLFFVKIGTISSKPLAAGEQEVLRILIEKVILDINYAG